MLRCSPSLLHRPRPAVPAAGRPLLPRPSARRPALARRGPPHPPAALPSLPLLPPSPVADVADGLEEPVQALYLAFLLGFLVVGAYLVVRQVREKETGGGNWRLQRWPCPPPPPKLRVRHCVHGLCLACAGAGARQEAREAGTAVCVVRTRPRPLPIDTPSNQNPLPPPPPPPPPFLQVLIRRELEEAAKVLGERVRTGAASPADSFELGVILLRKKLYTSALKALDRARSQWDGPEEDLAQVLNAVGYANFQLNKLDAAVAAYDEAVRLQPGYVIAWNNLGDAREKRGEWAAALAAYEATLALDPANGVARARGDACRARLSGVGGGGGGQS